VPMMRFGSAIKAPGVTLITRSSHRRSSFNIASTSLGAANEMHVFGRYLLLPSASDYSPIYHDRGSDYRRVCAFSNARQLKQPSDHLPSDNSSPKEEASLNIARSAASNNNAGASMSPANLSSGRTQSHARRKESS